MEIGVASKQQECVIGGCNPRSSRAIPGLASGMSFGMGCLLDEKHPNFGNKSAINSGASFFFCDVPKFHFAVTLRQRPHKAQERYQSQKMFQLPKRLSWQKLLSQVLGAGICPPGACSLPGTRTPLWQLKQFAVMPAPT